MNQMELFDQICADLRDHGFSIRKGALPVALCEALLTQAKQVELKSAGVGRGAEQALNERIRGDSIAWIDERADAQGQWLDFAEALRLQVNRQLLLGLFSFESHFAMYKPGAFYKKHVDAFKGQANRVLSVVAYLNPDWSESDGGQLVLYSDLEPDLEIARVQPQMGTLVVFLSEDFPHEVLPAIKNRCSIAGWYRVNTSQSDRVDPPK